MGTQVWYLITLIVLVSIKGESLADDLSKIIYGKSESSTPKPPKSAPNNRIAGMKELVLYLTPDQAKVLEDAGAIVQPFPEYADAFYSQRYQQNVEQTETQYKPASGSSNTDSKQETELDEYYKLLNIQQINEDLSTQTESPEPPTEKPRPKYKYVPRTKQQEYSQSYMPKKANKTKSQPIEYVRYLPHFEFEDVKIEPYRSRPLPGYRFEDIQTIQPQLYPQNPVTKRPSTVDIISNIQESKVVEIPRKIQTPKTVEILEDFQRPKESQTIRSQTYGIEPQELQLSLKPFVETQLPQESSQPSSSEESNIKSKGAVLFETILDRELNKNQNAKIWESTQDTEDKQNPLHAQTATKVPESVTRIEIQTGEIKEDESRSSVHVPNTAEIENQFSSLLLAPLVQHEKIVESMAQLEKEHLEVKEHAIHAKLKEIKESDSHDERKYAAELDKLQKNLKQQNELAQQLALEAVSKKPESADENDASKRRRPINLFKQDIPSSTPLYVKVPQTLRFGANQRYALPLAGRQPIPVPVQTENIQFRKPVSIEIGKHFAPGAISKNPYLKVNKPYLTPKSNDNKQEIPIRYPIDDPDKYTIIRHIWEH